MVDSDCKELVGVLGAMRSYMHKENNSFHAGPKLGYCYGCRAIRKIAGNYYRSTGRDCDGKHYEEVQSKEKCFTCESDQYVPILNTTDVFKLTPDELMAGITKGLERMSSPSLFNEDLPKKERAWNRLSKKNKIKQIKNWHSLIKKREKKREELNTLEQAFA